MCTGSGEGFRGQVVHGEGDIPGGKEHAHPGSPTVALTSQEDLGSSAPVHSHPGLSPESWSFVCLLQ